MKKIFLIILLTLIIIVCVILLLKIKQNPENKENIKEGEKVSNIVENKKTFIDENSFYSIKTEYPIEILDKNNDIENFIMSNVKQRQEDWKIGGELYNSEKQLKEEFSDRPDMIYSFDTTYKKIDAKNKGIKNYVFLSYEYTGGAHPNNWTTTFSFDKNGRIDIQNILDFSDYKDIELTKILAEKLKGKEFEDRIVSDMLEQGLGLSYLEKDGKSINKEKCSCDGFFFGSNFQNFYIKDTGITFIFSPYQIAPYAAGTIEVELDWELLKPFLK